MKPFIGAAALLVGVLSHIVAAAPPSTSEQRDLLAPITERDEPAVEPRQGCSSFSNNDRACWRGGYDLRTDWETDFPDTGVVRKYTLEITEKDNWTGPDGVVKEKVMLVNGNILGPTIFADWGDTVEVTVINNLEHNGTSIHWHGMHQKKTILNDGVNGILECPIPPKGGKKVYRFRAQQYGTSWYHSHFSAQYGNGVVGTIVFYGPASADYDIDLGVFPISDYYYQTADRLVEYTKQNGPPPANNILFNGTAKHPTTGEGEYANVTLTPGKRHRLRLINTSVEAHFQLSLVNHNMTIITADTVPVQPRTVDSLFIGVGQRYDVIIDANQTPGNYWFNVTFSESSGCGEVLSPDGETPVYPAAIFHYAGAPGDLPTNPGGPVRDHKCLDLIDLKPVVPRKVPVDGIGTVGSLDIHLETTPYFKWTINGSAIDVDWQNPVIDYVINQNTSFPPEYNVVEVEGKSNNHWTIWLIQNDMESGFSLPHPMHLHGHDFYILGRSPQGSVRRGRTFEFNPARDAAQLNGNLPLRRDTAMLPEGGWMVVAFMTDNPGAWLFHCHIAWHVSWGLSVTYLERPGEILKDIPQADLDQHNRICKEWREYWPTNPYPKIDSGLRHRWVEEGEWPVKI